MSQIPSTGIPTADSTEAPAAHSPPPVAASVRRNTLWAAGAAVIMLWYGLGNWDLAQASTGERLFVYTLRIGGALMIVSALLSVTGLRHALLFDALVSFAIGLGLIASAALLYSGPAMQALLNVLFGVVFIHSGYRNWADYHLLAPQAVPAALEASSDAAEA